MSTDYISSRRSFIRHSTLVSGLILSSGFTPLSINSKTDPDKPLKVSELKKPLAIAMWDFSWILRNHKYGEFENWDVVLEGLAERGYNAVRIDAMPQFIAADTDGASQEEFRSIKNDWTPALWGNDHTMSFRPREALLEFLHKCEKYEIKVGLATWFLRHGTDRTGIFLEEGGLLRAWEETLDFLKKRGLLRNVIYADILNEYPNWHGYDWFKNEMNKRSDLRQFKLDNPEANVPDPAFDRSASRYNALQQEFYNDFMADTLKQLKSQYPVLDIFASLDSAMDLKEIDLSEFNALDYHIWFEHRGDIPGLQEIRARDQSLDYRRVYADLISYWKENKTSLVNWMDGRIRDIAETASKNNIVCGNTEGWGPIMWFDHPELDWQWTKESAEICVELALKHENYKFICTSNFTHPQFKGMWEDKNWHRQLTSRIKQGP